MIHNPVKPNLAIKINHMVQRAFVVSPEHRRMSSITHMISAAFTWDCMTEFDKFVAKSLQLADEMPCKSYLLLYDICGIVHQCGWKSKKDESLQYVDHLEILMKHLIIREDKYMGHAIRGINRWVFNLRGVLSLVLNVYYTAYNLHYTKLQQLFKCNDIHIKPYCNTLKKILKDIEILAQEHGNICEHGRHEHEQYWNDIFTLIHDSMTNSM